MFGKHFASTYTGSMFGAGAHVFAVWGYVIANTIDGQIELNPHLLAAVLGADVAEVEKAIGYLCASDPKSRSQAEGGKRLIREGTFAYRVVNHEVYRQIRHEDDRRAYNRQKKAEARAKSKAVNMRVNDSQHMSAHTEAEAEAEADLKAVAVKNETQLRNGTTAKTKARPLPGFQRLRVFRWMVEELIGVLGDHLESFDLEGWLQALDQDGSLVIPETWPWLKTMLVAEVARRQLPVAGQSASFTKAELNHAKEVRRVRMGCRHEPRCGTFDACVIRIAQEVRAGA